jgi:hypothetical protein
MGVWWCAAMRVRSAFVLRLAQGESSWRVGLGTPTKPARKPWPPVFCSPKTPAPLRPPVSHPPRNPPVLAPPLQTNDTFPTDGGRLSCALPYARRTLPPRQSAKPVPHRTVQKSHRSNPPKFPANTPTWQTRRKHQRLLLLPTTRQPPQLHPPLLLIRLQQKIAPLL